MRCSPRIQFALVWRSTSPSPPTPGAAAAASPKSNFSTKKENTSPPPSLGIGQARGGYVASLLPDWLGLTRDLSCCVYVMFILNFLFLYTEYIEFHTHTHTRLFFGDLSSPYWWPQDKKTNESRLNWQNGWPLYISPLSWSTLLLKSLNLPVTLLETTRKLTSFQNIPLPDVQFLRLLRCSIDSHIFNFDPRPQIQKHPPW